MKKTLSLLAAVAVLTSNAYAAGALETVDEARARHSAKNYEIYEKRGTPLNGYPERLTDPAPPGTLQPGYAPKGSDYRLPSGEYRRY
ncbi:MAG: hypothetical protein M0Z99_26815 [Betaproteobacteria bacterium]|nr:hypothetical protein [Betaproteobacteria bacterium]